MHSYRFSSFVLDPKERRLLHEGTPVPLAPKAFDTLVYLVERAGHLVGKQELMQAIWRDSCVEDGNLPRTIHILRKALGEEDGGPRYIETIPTKGYRFVADIIRAAPEADRTAFSVAPAAPVPAAGSVLGTEARPLLGIVGIGLVLVATTAGMIWAGVGHRRAALEPTGTQTTSGAAYAKFQCRIRAVYDWDFAGAETECRRAVEPDPGNHEARRELAFLMNAVGRQDEALREMDAAIALAPTSFNKRSRGLLLYFSRRFDEAVAQLMQVQATDPEYREVSGWIARCLEQSGDYAQAVEFLIRNQESLVGRSGQAALLSSAFESGGWAAVLRASLPPGQPKPNLETAETLAQLGEADKAFEVLDGMIHARRVMIVHMDRDPRLDPLRTDPRFEQIARRVGLR